MNVKDYENLTLQEIKNRFIRALSGNSFQYMEENLVPEYKLRNAQKGNIYSEVLNTYWIQEDKDRAKDCRNEFYRVKDLIISATTKEKVELAYLKKNFEAIVCSTPPV